MTTPTAKYRTVDAYAAALTEQQREVLDAIRRLIAARVPGVQESIGYQIPVFGIGGTYLIYVGVWKHHVGLYPVPPLPAEIEADIEPYRTTAATVRFLHKHPIPYDLIERLIDALLTIRLEQR